MTYKLRCPKCGVWGFMSRAQFEGELSILCECGFSDKIDFRRLEP